MKRKGGRKSGIKDTDSANGVEDEQKEVKRVKKDDSEVSGSEEEEEQEDCQYEVESILDEKSIKGVRHYLIRWKGYTEESDTWEPENTLDCKDLIKEYKKKGSKKEKKKAKKEAKDENGEETTGEYEVDRILDVYFKKDGKREFLVHWKGYTNTDNTWEPEENMDCPELIKKFMAKVDQVKQVDSRELRTAPKPVQRLTLMTKDSGRRLSRRNQRKETIHYYDAE